MTADLNAAANQLTADIMAEVEASEWLRGRERAAAAGALRFAAASEFFDGSRLFLNECADRIEAAS